MHTRRMVRWFNTPSVPAGMRFLKVQRVVHFRVEFNLAWQGSFRTFNWREAVGDPDVMISQVNELLAQV